MGTNYYAHLDTCPHCDRAEVIHIGKKSHGWEFSFHGTDSIRSWADWKVELQRSTARIFDEYGRKYTFEEFAEVVTSQKGTGQNHFDYCKVHHPSYVEGLWKDDEGFCFNEGEFS